MSYRRVIPRDLFNEGDLLKCLGRLCIELGEHRDHGGRFAWLGVSEFIIIQDPGDGSIFVSNLHFTVWDEPFALRRPLNARTAWPLYLIGLNDEVEIRVFDDQGLLSAEMLEFLRKRDPR